MTTLHDYILTFSCPDKVGITGRITSFLASNACNILECAQFCDPEAKKVYMRCHFRCEDPYISENDLRGGFEKITQELGLDGQLYDAHHKPRTLLLVSKIGHCLNDILFRHKSGLLPVDICGIVSNHTDFASLAENHGIAFHHFPLANGAGEDAKQAQEARILNLIDEHQIELVGLARYMQILSPQLCEALAGRAINIHHSFLPSFKGGRPYYQAHDRGVKLIGATAHFVTSDLDEGPIIEQDVQRVNHTMNPESLTALGRDVECVVFARALKWFAERRILVSGHKTIIFHS